MNTKVKTILGTILFAAFLGITYLAYTILSDQYKPETGVRDNENNITLNTTIKENVTTEQDTKKYTAPDFTVFNQQGNKVKLSDFTDKPVVLNFWASWCPPCKSEMPHFNDVYADFKNDVVFMMVDLVDGMRETQAKGLKYVQDQNYDFSVYFDNEQSAANTYGITSIPATLFISADGNIVTAYEGAIDKGTLIAGINAIQK